MHHDTLTRCDQHSGSEHQRSDQSINEAVALLWCGHMVSRAGLYLFTRSFEGDGKRRVCEQSTSPRSGELLQPMPAEAHGMPVLMQPLLPCCPVALDKSSALGTLGTLGAWHFYAALCAVPSRQLLPRSPHYNGQNETPWCPPSEQLGETRKGILVAAGRGWKEKSI